MGDIQTRPFSKNYSGLINQSVIAVGITVLCVTGQEIMKRRRRGTGKTNPGEPGELGSRETWEFGYLFQGRSWAWKPSPPTPQGWPLSWIPQVIKIPEEKMNELRGVDATLYIRFLRGCFYFTLLHTFTTFPILFPIHVRFSDDSIDPKSMTRASISSLVTTHQGKSLLWIHICLLFWITLSWIVTLFWIAHGAFMLRAASIQHSAQRENLNVTGYHPHPHPQYAFTSEPTIQDLQPSFGLRLRTVMVSNVPPALRSEKELKEYFQYWMSRKLERPAIGITSSTQPGFINKSFAFLFNRARRLPVPVINATPHRSVEGHDMSKVNPDTMPQIDRVVIVRKMTELASLLERREEVLRLLETAHIKLANSALKAVRTAMEEKETNQPFSLRLSRARYVAQSRKPDTDSELGDPSQEGTLTEDQRMERLIKVLSPYVDEFEMRAPPPSVLRKRIFRKLRQEGSSDSDEAGEPRSTYPPTHEPKHNEATVWDALLSLPRSALDAYQPLINLSHLFRGKTVPSIDYYTAKLNLLTSLITENRAKHASEYDPVSTAFVTFADPADARRACTHLAVHPDNPLTCLIQMAPEYQDIDWIRVMKSSFDAEFVKDWVVSLGVWAFTVFWLFPVSLLVGLVSIQNISAFWPGLKAYLDQHDWEEEVLQSFIPTLLVALLALLIPLILLLIAKKAHTITTLSAMHDRIMTRYYKFLVVNVLVFFCVGTAALQSILTSFKISNKNNQDILQVVASSFPTAGPFYVGWQIFTTAIHGGFEIMLLGLPLILYPATRGQVTPRKRATGIRPRTFNYYYWLPTHLLLIHVLVVFAVLNPFVLPFGCIYFFVESGLVKNQLIHVYAKNYEGNGKLLLVRLTRYSLDGLILSHAVFLAYMVVLKKTVNVALAAVLIILTTLFKIGITRILRTQFEHDDIMEAEMLFGSDKAPASPTAGEHDQDDTAMEDAQGLIPHNHNGGWSLRVPEWVSFAYGTIRQRHRANAPPNPFRQNMTTFSRIGSRSTEGHGTTAEPKYAEHPPLSLAIDALAPIEPQIADDDDLTGPVVPHPPPVAWDDMHTPDLPYDNPYYVRPIKNVLWLPRNPCGILNLDETVDLKTSITVEPSTGKLGTWQGMAHVESPMEMSQVSLGYSELAPTSEQATRTPKQSIVSSSSMNSVDGTEDIELPLAIARRVREGGEHIEHAMSRRPSTFRRPSTSKGRRGSGTSSTQPFLKSYRSFSDGIGSAESQRARATSIMSSLDVPRAEMSDSSGSIAARVVEMSSTPERRTRMSPSPDQWVSEHGRTLSPDAARRKRSFGRPQSSGSKMSSLRRMSHGDGLRPDAHAQAEFVDHANRSHTSLHNVPSPLRRAENLSAHQAIMREVMAEEQDAFIDRMDAEQAEASKTTRSILTSWLYRKTGPEEEGQQHDAKAEGSHGPREDGRHTPRPEGSFSSRQEGQRHDGRHTPRPDDSPTPKRDEQRHEQV
ncbi:DUF221-domain-containing protein [Cylindrobasidium torrendii FP15055 ss-10]|uniref:DUF221-domain-containing protein n=1 Tax=Cylindrobasidium torrendii FP15055 ss-10 TaxID=1314674 RepID=A0A0D7BQB5_9AGAR|nr:DUF221-domain-containing protein [Cylindrobasidium torrendii FP15055 ss-10]